MRTEVIRCALLTPLAAVVFVGLHLLAGALS